MLGMASLQPGMQVPNPSQGKKMLQQSDVLEIFEILVRALMRQSASEGAPAASSSEACMLPPGSVWPAPAELEASKGCGQPIPLQLVQGYIGHGGVPVGAPEAHQFCSPCPLPSSSGMPPCSSVGAAGMLCSTPNAAVHGMHANDVVLEAGAMFRNWTQGLGSPSLAPGPPGDSMGGTGRSGK